MNDSKLDIFTEPTNISVDTLKNLGPLAALAGTFEGAKGVDLHPEATGPAEDAYVERYTCELLDPQTNGPQLLYGLRYHIFITKPGDTGTFHDQIGYWLWEPATGAIIQTLAIPRGQIAMASGIAKPDAKRFTLKAEYGSPHYGICTNPFLDRAFKTLSYEVTVTVHDDGSWSYEQDTVLKMDGTDTVFHHTDRNRLTRIAPPKPNPKMR